MIRLRPSGADEVLIKRVRDWYEPGPGVFIAPQALFNPALLFTTGVNGAWYDPSDLNTLFQNAAGTTPVTAVEQPVGLMLDKSGKGNHAFNSSGNSANFPVLSARYNLLTKTEDFSDAVWFKSGATPSVGGLVSINSTAGSIYQVVTCTPNTTYIFSEDVKLATLAASDFKLAFRDDTAGVFIAQDVLPAQAVNSSVFTRITQTVTTPAGCTTLRIYIVRNSAISSGSVYLKNTDLRVANDALGQPAYQRVNTATDYDTVGFKPYLKFNGTNQWLQTNSIDFSYGDKMFVCAGVRKLSDAATGVVTELGTDTATVNGSFRMNAPGAGGVDRYSWISRGSTPASATALPTEYPAPITNVLSGIGNISGDQAILRVNGTQVASSASDQGTGNYGNYPLYTGARAGTSLWANIRFYGAVIAGKQASDSEIGQTEAFINQKTGAY